MPLYEFICRKCENKFTELSPIDWQGKVKCPDCGGDDLVKAVSMFGGKSSGGGHSCGSCSSQKCSGCH